MLDCVKKVIPISSVDWDLVASYHATYVPEKKRTANSIKRKFGELARKDIPTGNPHIPDHVKYAKKISAMIVRKSDGDTGSHDEALGPEDEPEDAEEEEEEEDTDPVMPIEGVEPAAATAATDNDAPPDVEAARFSTPRRRATPITRTKRGGRGGRDGDEDDEPSFRDIMFWMNENQVNDNKVREEERKEANKVREEERKEAREERRERLEEAREERRQQREMQLQMMQSNQQMMMSMMMMMTRGSAAAEELMPLTGASVVTRGTTDAERNDDRSE